jgi:invasion protein IalB
MNQHVRSLGLLLATLAAASLAAFAAFAQDAPAKDAPAKDAPAPAAAGQAPQVREVVLKADPSQANWVKVCGKDKGAPAEICLTQRSFVTETNQPIIAMAVYEPKGAPNKFIRFIVPLGFQLERGIRYTVDKDKAIGGKYQVCLANGCFVEVLANDAVIKSLKGGKVLKLEVQNQLNQVIAFMAPLDGFAAAFDGPAIDPKQIEEQNKKLEAELAKRVEEQKKILEDQAKATPPAQ